MNFLKKIKGQNRIIYLYDDCIEISRNTFGGIVSQGQKGNRRFYFVNISSIEYKTPKLTSNGYFKIIVSGTSDINAGVGLLGSSLESMKDPNTVVLTAFSESSSKNFDIFYQDALVQLEKNKDLNRVIDKNESYLEDLKKLGDLLSSGVLTQSEFDAEKKYILEKR